MVNRPTTTIAMNSAAIAGTKYRSAVDGPCVGCGACVGAAASTLNAAIADDGQYDSLPANAA